MSLPTLAPGQRITLRSEDFLVTKSHGAQMRAAIGNKQVLASYIVDCEGLSELVRGQRFTFDLAIDSDFEVVRAEETLLFADQSVNYAQTRLYLESRLRSADVDSTQVTLAHRAALDPAEYQLEPALRALRQPFARILIADAVGLGKTAEVGILLTELMRRGRAKRVLVLALKSVLAQFQQEIWDRFGFPLVRLDSEGVSSLRAKLPANKNPFNYYDRVIVSIDTLKKNGRFQHYLERTRWDVVVIDECHNVANSGSQRGGLAELLARRCDNLIFTSATPHNGDVSRFANLMRMLEPTIVQGDGFDTDSLKQHVIRRAKRDLPKEVQKNFCERELHAEYAELLPAEVDFLAWQQNFKTDEISEQDGRNLDALFSVSIFKAYLSSPFAAEVSLRKRLKDNERLREKAAAGEAAFGDRKTGRLEREAERLPEGLRLVREVLGELSDAGGTAQNAQNEPYAQNAHPPLPQDAKLRKLVEVLRKLKWKGTKSSPRIVLFAERVDTLLYLETQLAREFGLREVGTDENRGHSQVEGIARFDGSLPDTQQQRVIEDFGLKDSATRLLLTSDAGSQGVNLHYECSTMINYDLPWSLITLEQRNGRIDRYGQKHTPHIYYLLAKSELDGLQTDLRIVDRIREKEEEAYETLGDAGAIMQLNTVEAEERATSLGVAKRDLGFADKAANALQPGMLDLNALLALGNNRPEASADDVVASTQTALSLYGSDQAFYHALVAYLKAAGAMTNDAATWVHEDLLQVEVTRDLREQLFDVPREALPGKGKLLQLSLKPAIVMQAIADSRKQNKAWSDFQLLYDAHPLAQHWLMAMQTRLPKGQAPVCRLRVLPKGQSWYLFYGQATNSIGTSLLSDFYAVGLDEAGDPLEEPLLDLAAFWRKPELVAAGEELWTPRATDAETLARLQSHLVTAVELGRSWRLEPALAELRQKMERRQLAYGERAKGESGRQGELFLDEGLKRYDRFTTMRQGSHVQVLGVIWG